MAGTVLTVSSRALLAGCERLGIDSGRVLREAGVDRALVDDPDGRIAVEAAGALWAAAHRISGDPDLALHAAEALPFGAYKVIDFLGSSAPTIGAALTAVSRYFPIVNTAITLPFDEGPGVVRMRVQHAEPALLTRPYAEYLLAAVYLRTRHAVGADYRPIIVELSHSPPPSTAEHERIFGCPVHFGAGGCAMTVSRGDWDTPAGRPDGSLFEVLHDHARLLLERVPGATGLTTEVRAAIAAELRGGDPGLEHVCRKLATSARTLQRRLQDVGASYSDLVDEMRHAASATYLADRDLALTEVAYLLGFAEQSSFTRAFKRWTGQTPTEYRRRVLGTAA